MEKTESKQKKIKGISLSPGVAMGRAVILENSLIKPIWKNINEKDIENEYEKLDSAIAICIKELEQIIKRLKSQKELENAKIIEAQLAILQDKTFIKEMKTEVEKQKYNIEWVVYKTIEKYVDKFSELEDEYLRQRALDIKDVGNRILKKLTLIEDVPMVENSGDEEIILVTSELFPSFATEMKLKNMVAIITKLGNITSHAAILARSMAIPAISGIDYSVNDIANEDYLIVDAHHGNVYQNPTEATIQKYEALHEKDIQIVQDLQQYKNVPTKSKDGIRIHLQANISKVDDVYNALQQGAEGIGLYRTEFLFLSHKKMPTEKEQFENYKKIVTLMEDRTVVIRVLDVGGDKNISYLNMPIEPNPFMGYRSIRFLLNHEEVFLPQLKAIYRAGAYGKVRLLIPMVTKLEEVYKIKELCKKAQDQLTKEGKDFDETIRIGIMIEVPLAALNLENMLQEVDYISIGSNDLYQYLCATDRSNDRMSYLYNTPDPTFLSFLFEIIQKCKDMDKKASICGEIAGQPKYLLPLLSMGFEFLSMSSSFIPMIKKMILDTNLSDCNHLMEEIKQTKTATELNEYLHKIILENYAYSELFDI